MSSPIKNIKTFKALRGEAMVIDLKKSYTGTLTAWMKRDPNDLEYRSFDIIDGRYLALSKEKASDYYDIEGVLLSRVFGKWYFDVERIAPGDTEAETIYTGTIYFANDVTNSVGVEITDPNLGNQTAPIPITYPSIVELVAGQTNQKTGWIYEVVDGSGFPDMSTNRLWVRYSGTTVGNHTDYTWEPQSVANTLQEVVEAGGTVVLGNDLFIINPNAVGNGFYYSEFGDGIESSFVSQDKNEFIASVTDGNQLSQLNVLRNSLSIKRELGLFSSEFFLIDPIVANTQFELRTPAGTLANTNFVLPLSVEGILADVNGNIDLTTLGYLVASDLQFNAVTPLDAYFGNKLQPKAIGSEGLYVTSANNKSVGYVANATGTGNAVISEFRATINSDPFATGITMSVLGSNYYAPWLRENGLLFSSNNLHIMTAESGSSITLSLGKTSTSSVLEGDKDKVLILGSNRTITAPSLTNALIDTGGLQSLITKGYLDAGYVNISGVQTITGIKTFSASTTMTGAVGMGQHLLFSNNSAFGFGSFSSGGAVIAQQSGHIGIFSSRTNGYPALFNTLNLTSTKTFELPDESGVVALVGQSYTDTEVDLLLDNYQLLSEKGVANGYVPLDSGAKISASYLPDSIIGQVEYQSTWNANTNTPAVGDPTLVKGHYFVTSVSGSYLGIPYEVGDWIISNGVAWEKVDNTDAVTSVFGRIGSISALEVDYAAFYEPIFSKNTGFNKNFGIIAGTVAEGNHTHAFADITSKPTTIAGYGITDAYTKTEADNKYLLNTTDTLAGNLTVTGILNAANIEFSASNPFMLGMDNDGVMSLVGGDSILSGAAIRLYGGLHATLANDIAFISNNVNVGYWDNSASTWNFNGAIIGATGNITGGSFIKSGGLSTQFLKADGSVDSTTYLPSSLYTAADVLAKLLTVDGVGSGLDADTIDGIDSESFLRSNATDIASELITFNKNIIVSSLVDGLQPNIDIKSGVGLTGGWNRPNLSLTAVSGDSWKLRHKGDDSNFLEFLYNNVAKITINTSGNIINTGIITSQGTGNNSFAGNVGITTSFTPSRSLTVGQSVLTSYPVLGTPYGSTFISGDNGLYGLYIGVNTSSGNVSFQQMRNDSAVAYNILLNPAGGNVGIGKTNPSERLHIYQSGLSSYKTYSGTLEGAILTAYQSQASPFTKTTDLAAGSDGTVPSEIRFLTRTSGVSTIDERMRISSTGNVSIGNTNNTHKLDVTGSGKFVHTHLGSSSGGGIGFNRNTENGVIYDNTRPAFQIFNNNTSLVFQSYNSAGTNTGEMFYKEGKLGISVSDPTHKLDVAGTGRFTSTVVASPATLSTELVTKGQLDDVKFGTRITNAAVTGTYALDHNAGNDWKITLTGNTTFSDTNLPTGTDTINFTIKITGAFIPTWPTYWDVIGDVYDGSKWNFISVQVHIGTAASEEVTAFITNFP